MSSAEAPLLGTLCCVPNCINSYGNGECAIFYHLPVNSELCEIWKTRINNPSIMHLSNDSLREVQVCELHFDRINKTKWGLQKNSLPTLGLSGFSEPSNQENCFEIPRLQLVVNQLQSICRICYSQENLYDISRSKYQNMTIENIFNNLTNDKYFSKQNFPCNVCLSCIKLLIQNKLFMEQTDNAATLFDQLLAQDQHCINVITTDFDLILDESLKNCQLQLKNICCTDNGIKNQNDPRFESVYLPTMENATTNNFSNIKAEYHQLPSVNNSVNCPLTNNKDSLESSVDPTTPIESVDATLKDTNNDSNSNISIPGQSSNPVVMIYNTFVRTTRRSSHVNNQPHNCLDTNSGPILISYLTDEGSKHLNPSSVELPTSSGRYSGIIKIPAIDIRCNMDSTNQENDEMNQNKSRKHSLDSSTADLEDISQILEVKMDVDKSLDKSKTAKVYRCEHCTDEFTDKFDYKRHKKEHNAKKFMCTICQATFNTGTECSKHKMSHTRACEVCGKSVQRKCYMNHLKTHDEGHTERYEQVKLKGQKLCKKCGRVFKRRWAFHAPCHTSSGPGKFQCDQCPFRTHYHKTLKQHMLVHAPAGDQFVCATCGDCFGAEDVLNKHMKLQHLRSVKLFPCKWCASKFETRYERTKHLTTDHGKKPLREYHHPPTKFRCNYCSMTFVTADNLRLHLWSHPNATDAELELNHPSTSKAKVQKKK